MKKLLFYVVSVIAVCCHGGLFDSALKTVNKAAEVVNAVDEARKPPAEAPQEVTPQSPLNTDVAPQSPVVSQPAQDTASVSAKDMPWDAAGYQSRVAKVNEAMQKVAPKLPFNGVLNDWYNAAYGLTTTERQYSFLPPDQRVARISEDNRVKIDKFIEWVDGGMQVFDSVKDEADNQRREAAKAEEERRAAEEAQHQANLVERKELVAKLTKIVDKYTSEAETCKKVAKDYADKCSKGLEGEVRISEFYLPQNENERNWNSFLDNKKRGKYDEDPGSVNLGDHIQELKNWLDEYESGKADSTRKRDESSAGEPSSVTIKGLETVSSPVMKSSVERYMREVDREVADVLANQARKLAEKVDQELDKALQNKEISAEFRNRMSEERWKEANKTPEKMSEILQKIKDEIASNKQKSQIRAGIIEKLPKAEPSTWAEDLKKFNAGEERNAVFAEVLQKRYGEDMVKESELPGLRTLVSGLYSKDDQRAMFADYYKTPDSILACFAQTIDDAGFRKELLMEDWSNWPSRHHFAYLLLVSKETNVDVLMEVYERQDRYNFRYEKKAKPDGEMTAGDMLEKMMKDYADNNGAGYGRLGEWMYDNCGKEFCKRVDKLVEARRKVAKGQMFLIKDFYLGMPHRDARRVMRNWDKKKTGWVSTYFGSCDNGTLSEIRFGAKARVEYLGVKKDGLTGLGQFVTKYIPGGMDSVGELKVGGEVETGYDPENPEVKVKSWWYTDCPKYDCRIKMFDSGTICIVNTSDEDYPKLDFSGVK